MTASHRPKSSEVKGQCAGQQRVGVDNKPTLPKSQIPKLNRSLQELNKINRQQYNFINNKQNAPFGSVNILNTYVNQDAFDKKVT